MKIEEGQRWHYTDQHQDVLIEVISERDGSYGPASRLYRGKTLQCKKGSRTLGQIDTWNFDYGNWELLKGQDAPLV